MTRGILRPSGIDCGSRCGYYPAFHTLASVGRKQYFQYVKRLLPLFRAIVNFTFSTMKDCKTIHYLIVVSDLFVEVELFHLIELGRYFNSLPFPCSVFGRCFNF